MKTFITLTVLLGCLAIAAVFGYRVWTELEEVEMSQHGWIALSLGGGLTFLVGAGLMTLVFFSHRRGYDDRTNRPDE